MVKNRALFVIVEFVTTHLIAILQPCHEFYTVNFRPWHEPYSEEYYQKGIWYITFLAVRDHSANSSHGFAMGLLGHGLKWKNPPRSIKLQADDASKMDSALVTLINRRTKQFLSANNQGKVSDFQTLD